MKNITQNYYKNKAGDFIKNTGNLDLSTIYAKFVPLVKPGGKILDAGCGSGRDSLHFKKQGFKVLALDNCKKFVEHTRELAGVKTICKSFSDLNYDNEFDGIWACASLLHLPENELKLAFDNLVKALKAKGVFYLSFKYGDFAGERNGRFFTDLTETSFQKLLVDKNVEIIEIWLTQDHRPEKANEKWLNVLISKC